MLNKPRLSVADLLALIAATALGLAITRSLPNYFGWHAQVLIDHEMTAERSNRPGWKMDIQGLFYTTPRQSFFRRPSYWLGQLPYWVGPSLVSGTFASLAIALRGPKPRLRRLARKPGMAAGLAVLLALGVEALQIVQASTTNGILLADMSERWESYWAFVWISLPRLAGYTVAAWWLALALSGRWSAERNAGGKLGRALGW